MNLVQRDLLGILCCPTDKGDLDLAVMKEEAGEILEGTLTCRTCRHAYPIEDGIPNLLPPEFLEE